MQGIMNLSIVLLLVAAITTMAIVSNPAYAGTGSHLHFKNKAECMEYVIEGTNVVRNHAVQKAKISKEVADKLCAQY
jgi:hypothetical protein